MRALYALSVLTALTQCKQPNIVFVLTDDQDLHMDSMEHMPFVQKHIISQGTLYDNHYCTVAICCPSRVNLWTGRAAHNTNVTDLFPPYGGYPVFVNRGLNENWLPIWLQDAGYSTYYVGKLFNSHSVDNYDKPPVNGFTGSEFLLDPYTYDYYNSRMTRNGGSPVSYEGLYSPDVVAEKAYGFLDEATQQDQKPFFLAVAPIAPHANVASTSRGLMAGAAYAPRHAHLFKDYKIPRTPNFNPDLPNTFSWLKELDQLNETVVEYNDEFQRSRLRALQSVDEMVDELVRRLEAKGILDDTYIVYSTDNGYHISQYRLPPGKECPFETDIHIPLAIRGPNVPAGRIANVVSSHTDLTPTILKLAGVQRDDLDGFPIPLTKEELDSPQSGEHVNVEFWGLVLPEGIYGKLGNESLVQVGGPPIAAGNSTYKALRLIGKGYNLMYAVWCTGEKQFFDLESDPYEINNYFDANQTSQQSYALLGRSVHRVLDRLDALLMVTKSCKAKSCHEPWRTMHLEGDVKTLTDALAEKYDDFYAEQPKINFKSCQLGYLVGEEGPQDVSVWSDFISSDAGAVQETFRYHGDWSLWT